jgi:hypothetical protein
MILVVIAALCVITVPLTGGSIGQLGKLRLRWLWLAPVALAVQVLIVTIAPGGSHSLHAAVHIGTYVLLGVFLVANRGIPGAPTIALGALANTIAVLANGGVMPASLTAQRIAGLAEGGGFHNSAAVAHPHLLWLGDIIPVPGPLPNVLSVGDLIIFAGMLVLLHKAAGTTLASAKRPPASSHASTSELRASPPA